MAPSLVNMVINSDILHLRTRFWVFELCIFVYLGADECTSDVIELCTMYKLSGNSSSIISGDTSELAYPFVQCMEINEGSPSKAESCFASTLALTTTLTWDVISSCSSSESQDVQNVGALSTPSKPYLPHTFHCFT